MNLGADPVHGERDESYVVSRVETLDGFHEADVAFLDEVIQWQAIAGVALGDMHHKTQVRHNELACGVEVFFFAVTGCERLFVLFGQDSYRADSLNIGVKTAYRACQCEIVISHG